MLNEIGKPAINVRFEKPENTPYTPESSGYDWYNDSVIEYITYLAQRLTDAENLLQNKVDANALASILFTDNDIAITADKITILGDVTFLDYIREQGNPTGAIDPSITKINGGVITTGTIKSWTWDNGVTGDIATQLNLNTGLLSSKRIDEINGDKDFFQIGKNIAIKVDNNTTITSNGIVFNDLETGLASFAILSDDLTVDDVIIPAGTAFFRGDIHGSNIYGSKLEVDKPETNSKVVIGNNLNITAYGGNYVINGIAGYDVNGDTSFAFINDGIYAGVLYAKNMLIEGGLLSAPEINGGEFIMEDVNPYYDDGVEKIFKVLSVSTENTSNTPLLYLKYFSTLTANSFEKFTTIFRYGRMESQYVYNDSTSYYSSYWLNLGHKIQPNIPNLSATSTDGMDVRSIQTGLNWNGENIFNTTMFFLNTKDCYLGGDLFPAGTAYLPVGIFAKGVACDNLSCSNFYGGNSNAPLQMYMRETGSGDNYVAYDVYFTYT